MQVEFYLAKSSHANQVIDGEVTEWPEGIRIDSYSGEEITHIANEDIEAIEHQESCEIYTLNTGVKIKITYEDNDNEEE